MNIPTPEKLAPVCSIGASDRRQHSLWGVGALLAVLLAPATVFSAQDDEVINGSVARDESPVAWRRQIALAQEFDRYFFRSAEQEAVRLRFEQQLTRQFADFGVYSHLNAAQREKLLLAAAVDVQRFFNEVDATRRRFLARDDDQFAFRQLYEKEILPLQRRMASGIYGEGSSVSKLLLTMLGAEEEARRAAAAAKRRRLAYRASVASNLVALGEEMGFTDEQKAALIQLVLEETQMPNSSGSFEAPEVLAQLASVPEEKVKPLLSERQREQLKRRLAPRERKTP